MLDTVLSPWPSYTPEEVEAVSRVLSSNRVNYWTGSECRQFELEFAHWCGCSHAVTLANGTLALDVALNALGVQSGDEVVVTPRSFMASVSCVVTAGAIPVFADVDRDTQNITAATIERVVTPRTRAIVCVHLAGMPCDMDPIMALARRHGLAVVEDCAQAHGARYRDRCVGTIGHVGAWSFCQDKIMTTGGEGGMVTTEDGELWSRMWSYKDHGKSWDSVYRRSHPPGFRWVHDSFGTNWRMLEMQAVIGRIQLTRMSDWTARRTEIAAKLAAALQVSPAIRVPAVPDWAKHAYYRLYAFVRPELLATGWSRDRIIDELRNRGVPSFQGSCPEIYLERAFDGTGWRPPERLPVARELGETSLAFLVHPTLTDQEVDRMGQAIAAVVSLAAGG